jgi:hypothetical protein
MDQDAPAEAASHTECASRHAGLRAYVRPSHVRGKEELEDGVRHGRGILCISRLVHGFLFLRLKKSTKFTTVGVQESKQQRGATG